VEWIATDELAQRDDVDKVRCSFTDLYFTTVLLLSVMRAGSQTQVCEFFCRSTNTFHWLGGSDFRITALPKSSFKKKVNLYLWIIVTVAVA
jgi:hypothetical protein